MNHLVELLNELNSEKELIKIMEYIVHCSKIRN